VGRRATTWRRTGWVLPLLLLLGACGIFSDDAVPQTSPTITSKAFIALKPADIVTAAVADMARIKTYVLDADIELDGSPATLHAVSSDEDCSAVAKVEDSVQQYFQLGDDVYVKGNRDYWIAKLGEREGRAFVKEANDRWVHSVGLGAKETFCEGNYARLAQVAGARYIKGAVEKIGEQRAVPVDVRSRDLTMTVWVLASAPHYVVKMKFVGGPRPGSFTFTDLDKPVEIAAPAPDTVVDADQLGLGN
jgi:hypothetical protein